MAVMLGVLSTTESECIPFCNLVQRVVDAVAVADDSAFVDMAACENDLGHNRRVAVGLALLVDRLKLSIGESSDHHKAHPVSVLKFLEISANQRWRFFRKRQQCRYVSYTSPHC
jgi:hypothetical protein